jgi:hypothetical protein
MAKSDQNKRLKKFYYLSLLCLIPGFGILIGIVLLVYAIFVFRNVKLLFTILLAMAGGFLLIKVDSYYLEQDVRYGKDAENAFTLLSANGLDAIVQNLELYKLRYQQYPDSLQQLEKVNPELEIRDPLLRRNAKAHKFINFYYKKDGDKYVLFSAGVDGIPNTADDIYPRQTLK